MEEEIREATRNVMKLVIVGLAFYVLYLNYPLWKVRTRVEELVLIPGNRVVTRMVLGDKVSRLVGERVYFRNKALGFDEAEIKFKFLGEPGRKIIVGMRDQVRYHFLTQVVDSGELYDEWREGKSTFDLKDANFSRSEVQFMIYVPGASEHQSVLLKDVEVTLIKNSFVKR